MRTLHLFAGIGGGLLADLILGHTPIGAIEIDEYCCNVLRQRHRDGWFPQLRVINDDVRNIDGNEWQGKCDILAGGFPCQPFSTASRGRRVAPDLWPEMLRLVQAIGPRFVFAENVQRAPIEKAADDLSASGFTVRTMPLDAAQLGAPQRRQRWWLVADANGNGQPRRPVDAKVAGIQGLPRLAGWQNNAASLGVDDGVSGRMERLRALGNAQVPLAAAVAWKVLNELR